VSEGQRIVASEPVGNSADHDAMTVASNAGANIIRALASSSISVLLPMALLIVLPAPAYNAWAVIFSTAALAVYLDFGIPTTVQVLVSSALASGDHRSAKRATWLGLAVTLVSLAVVSSAVVVIALNLTTIFAKMPPGLSRSAGVAFVLLFAAQAATLCSNSIAGYWAGAQRSVRATTVLVPARLLAGLVCLATALVSHSLPLLAVTFLVPLLVGAFVLGMTVHWAPGAPRASNADETVQLRAVLRFTAPLIVWGVAMAVVSGLDLTLVGIVDYHAVRLFSVATVLTAGIVGICNAAFGSTLPEFARLHAIHDIAAFRSLLVQSGTLASTIISAMLATAVGFVALVPQLHGAWTYLALLGLGMAARVAVAPISYALVGSGAHRSLVLPPLLEAAMNLGLSILLGRAMGATGVALGTTVSAIVGTVVTMTYSSSKQPTVHDARHEYARLCFFRPTVILGPGAAGIALSSVMEVSALSAASIIIGTVLTLALSWRSMSPELAAWRRTRQGPPA
jgi:O-antigen/teichoic acid export membrane protein